ncbi:MAG: hypothetical protein SOR75_11450 [Synergistes jonesii]|uniref:hypothetical protein n=1 Tax=Synergistes jonesii TaxID=2754 RepID=UPI002A74BC52|nr:hypothetical protein [Synergistes jonesii]MDY2985925.1 hypothetical protein [Synergistes jonesii]
MPTSIYCHGWLTLADAPKKLTVRLEMFPQRLYGPEPPLYCPAFCNGTVSKPQLFKLSGDVQGVLFSSAEKAQKAIDEHREWLADVVKIDEGEIDEGKTAPKPKTKRMTIPAAILFASMDETARKMMGARAKGASMATCGRLVGKTAVQASSAIKYYSVRCGLGITEMMREYRTWLKQGGKAPDDAEIARAKLDAHFSRIRGDTLHMFHMAIRGADDKEIARATGKTVKSIKNRLTHHEHACGLNRVQMLIEFRSWENKNREGAAIKQ